IRKNKQPEFEERLKQGLKKWADENYPDYSDKQKTYLMAAKAADISYQLDNADYKSAPWKWAILSTDRREYNQLHRELQGVLKGSSTLPSGNEKLNEEDLANSMSLAGASPTSNR